VEEVMNVRRWLLLLACLTAACAPGPEGGGMSEDIGDEVSCTGEDHFDLAAETPLGFSGRQVLGLIEGRYRFPLHWSDPCDAEDACSVGGRCAGADARAVPAVAGTDTMMTLEVRAASTSARVTLPGEGQQDCGTGMFIPVEVRLESDDGAFALQYQVELWSERGTDAQSSWGELSQATGSALTGLPDGTRLELTLGGGQNDYFWFDMHLVTDRSSPALLKGAVAGSCVGEGRRSKFEQR
jgi:hypothetical protein